MTLLIRMLSFFALLFPVMAYADDAQGSADYPLIGRYEGSRISGYKVSDFDDVKLLSAPWKGRDASTGDEYLKVEGRSFRIVYELPEDRSSLEVFRNLETQMKAKGFQTIFTCSDEECLPKNTAFYQFADMLSDGQSAVYNASQDHIRYLLAKASGDGKDVYAALLVGEASDKVALLRVVEVKSMETDKIVFLKSSEMMEQLNIAGRVALYGIYFDTDKAEPKSESKPTLAEIAKLLIEKPNLNLIVVGHTDNQGEFDYNVDLSMRRAKSVVKALTTEFGIKSSRLTAFGDGMTAPVASNAEEEGRAKNRRVELVVRGTPKGSF